MKPRYIFMFKNKKAINDILLQPPFCYDRTVSQKQSGDGILYEYSHFVLECIYYINSINSRGYRCWQVLVESELYDELNDDDIMRFKMMMSPYEMCGGRIVRVEDIFYR